MPEGHTVHRIALQFRADLVGRPVTATSPQGRFAAGAALLDGGVMASSTAVGKHLLLAFGPPDEVVPDDELRWLHVHLGLYGAWDFHGKVSPLAAGAPVVGSIGAPRVRRAVRMGEGETALRAGRATRQGGPAADDDVPFPPDPVGQVRVRLATDRTVADLRGPITCEVLTRDEVTELVAEAGPDPRVPAWDDPQQTVVDRVTRRRVPIGQLLMDQGVISGIGNIYRAELLFRAGLEPHTPGTRVPAEVVAALWQDWVELLDDGVRTGVMITRADLDAAARAAAVADPTLRHAVYGRADEPCLRCGTPVQREEMAGRSLYWCPTCQV